jgi:hypothetical protein
MQGAAVCAICGGVIGEEERLIVVAPGSVRGTSLASDARLGDDATVLLHPRCAAPEVAAAADALQRAPGWREPSIG